MEPPHDLHNDPPRIRAAIVQTKPHKGRYEDNLRAAGDAFAQLADGDAPDLIVLPEAALTGYFLEGAVYDLALPAGRFADDLARTWRDACGERSVDLCCGFYENDAGTFSNSALYLHVERGESHIVHVHRKMFLATYGVFDEERFLVRGRSVGAFDTRFGRAAMLICEDMWHAIVPTIAAIKGARYLLVPSASPGRGIAGKAELESVERWQQILSLTALEHGIYVLYAGLAGFEGGKGMSGASCVIDPRGRTLVRASTVDAQIVRAELDPRDVELARAELPLLGDLETVLPDLLSDRDLSRGRLENEYDAAGR